MDSTTLIEDAKTTDQVPSFEKEVASTPAPSSTRLTVEVTIYLGLAALAGALRLWQLGLAPLAATEASQALVALELVQGGAPGGGGYSPLVVSLGSLAFFVFKISEVTIRLGPALLGTFLVLLPLGWRYQLGRTTALVVAALLALSPTALYLSRTANGEIGVAVGGFALAMVIASWNARRMGQPQAAESAAGFQLPGGMSAWLTGIGLALLVTSGPLAYSALLSLAVSVGVVIVFERRAGNLNWPSAARVRPVAGWAGALFLGLSTAALFNLDGIAATADLLTTWLGAFRPAHGVATDLPALALLVLCEPLSFWPGLIGAVLAIRRRDRLDIFLVAWLVASLLLDLLLPGLPNGAVVLPLLPLTLLAGRALVELGESLLRSGTWGREGLVLAVGMIMQIFAYVQLTVWTRCEASIPNCNIAWIVPIIVEAAFLALLAMFMIGFGVRAALRGFALTLVTLALLGSIASAWQLNYGPLRLLPYQPLAGETPAGGTVTLQKVLTNLSAEQVGDPHLLQIDLIESNSPQLRWLLRDFRHANSRPAREPGSQDTPYAPAVLTPPGFDLGQLSPDGAYAGQDFNLTAVWSPTGLDRKARVRWLLFREAPTMPAHQAVILWVRQD